MQKDLITVFVANYNNAEYLEQCLDSIINQTYKNLDILIIDDCSTDNSRDIILRYAKKYENIRYLFNEKNQGITSVRRESIKNVKGDFFTTLDSDDYYYSEDKLEKEIARYYEILERNNEASIIFSNILLIRPDKEMLVSDRLPIKEGDIFSDIFTRECVIPRDYLISKKMLGSLNYRAEIPMYEDWDLKIRLAKEYKFHYSGVIGTAYRRIGKGISFSKKVRHKFWIYYIFFRNLRLAKGERIKALRKIKKYLKSI